MDNITFMQRINPHRHSPKHKASNQPPSQERGFEWDAVTEQYASASFRSLPDGFRRKWFANTELSDFCVFSCGYYQRAEGHKWERSNLNEGIVIYCVDGRGHLKIHDNHYPVTAGDVAYCAPDTHHAYEAGQSDPWSIYWMHVSGKKLDKLGGFHHSFSHNPVQHIGLMPELIIFFRSLVQNFDTTGNPPRWLLSSLCAQHILAHIANAPKLEQGTIPHVKMLNTLIKHMHAIAETRVSLDELIKNTGFSKTYLCRLFKEFTGFSLMAYMNKIRIEKACVMLTTTEMMVFEISDRLGFDDPYYFSRLFKKSTGHSPRKFRKIHLADSRRGYSS